MRRSVIDKSEDIVFLVEVLYFQCFYPHSTVNVKAEFGGRKRIIQYYDVSVVLDLV